MYRTIGLPFFSLGFIGLGVALLIIWLWALVDLFTSRLRTDEKVFWVAVILVGNLIGAVIYLALVKFGDTRVFKNKKELKRSKDKVLAGVCSGIAEYMDTDKTVIRILCVLLFFMTGSAVLWWYLAAWVIMPEE